MLVSSSIIRRVPVSYTFNYRFQGMSCTRLRLDWQSSISSKERLSKCDFILWLKWCVYDSYSIFSNRLESGKTGEEQGLRGSSGPALRSKQDKPQFGQVAQGLAQLSFENIRGLCFHSFSGVSALFERAWLWLLSFTQWKTVSRFLLGVQVFQVMQTQSSASTLIHYVLQLPNHLSGSLLYIFQFFSAF